MQVCVYRQYRTICYDCFFNLTFVDIVIFENAWAYKLPPVWIISRFPPLEHRVCCFPMQILMFCSVLQGVCTLEGEEHSHREAGSDPQSSALDAGFPAQHADARTTAVHATVHRHHHQEVWNAHLDLGHAGRWALRPGLGMKITFHDSTGRH